VHGSRAVQRVVMKQRGFTRCSGAVFFISSVKISVYYGRQIVSRLFAVPVTRRNINWHVCHCSNATKPKVQLQNVQNAEQTIRRRKPYSLHKYAQHALMLHGAAMQYAADTLAQPNTKDERTEFEHNQHSKLAYHAHTPRLRWTVTHCTVTFWLATGR
jgi:hypothetical protein